ncbi:MAG: glycoside hydrolase family 140 protein [Bacteroidota bacterium]
MTKHVVLTLLTALAFYTLPAQNLKVSDNKRFLVTGAGEPFFWLGDTGWEMLHRLDRSEMEHYMRNRAGKGFTVIQTVIVSEIDGLTFPNMEGNLPFDDFDPEQPNEAYFELVDFAVRKAEEFHLVLALLPTWHRYVLPGSNPLQNKEAVFNPGNALAYGNFLGERYKEAPNVVWVLGGDWPAGPQLDIWDAMAEGLQKGDGGTHLKTYHPRGQQTSSTWLHNREWLDFNMVQTGHQAPSFNVYDWITNDYMLTPAKPVVNGEPAYEDLGIWFNPVNGRFGDNEIRKQAYWSVFAGAFGHTYGNNNIWQMNRNDEASRIWAEVTWDKALEHPGSTQMGIMRELMESRPFLTRIPDQDLIAGENPSHATDHVQATRDGTPGNNDATYIMVYLPCLRSVTIHTGVIKGDQLKIWWFDPRTGNAFQQGTMDNTGEVHFSNWESVIREEQGGPDWVVVIDDASAGYGRPGK